MLPAARTWDLDTMPKTVAHSAEEATAVESVEQPLPMIVALRYVAVARYSQFHIRATLTLTYSNRLLSK